ncbi:iodothyronine deiodinase [Acanthamoeba castellanii str. Neff]|uniref:Iodothyronine deiodinase n=1 Tax=Acanthamoeba castellanii (strain ATCC 30010 / Neff) TaxID=1257118 RepID=L8GY63_ACACF|nr:iodothyronine deiodinase [Acanthamoeba castellanii str. Neff]ELR17026.1 iodothyronine deiodinase [Acanthamoeba castellanii str. Neff]
MQAVFLSVYIDEAHPADGWALQCNDDDVDHMNDRACALFSAWPERLYIVQSGRIEFKGGPGPFGYILQDIDEWLADH